MMQSRQTPGAQCVNRRQTKVKVLVLRSGTLVAGKERTWGEDNSSAEEPGKKNEER